jgi:hypothetical protein
VFIHELLELLLKQLIILPCTFEELVKFLIDFVAFYLGCHDLHLDLSGCLECISHSSISVVLEVVHQLSQLGSYLINVTLSIFKILLKLGCLVLKLIALLVHSDLKLL